MTHPSDRNSRTGSNFESIVRRLPFGAEVQPSGGVHFRLWAPRWETVQIHLLDKQGESEPARVVSMQGQGGGIHELLVPDAEAGDLYQFHVGDGRYPDPASRYQPSGPHGPSQVVDPSDYLWSDEAWRGPRREGNIIYELHIGTFTPKGTWEAAVALLPKLADLGVTLLEVMPVADFPGRFGWGYDGVNLFAPTRLYGTPDEFRRFVDLAHGLGLGVILDVVYNHLGPDGNYLGQYSDHYFTDKHPNEWGKAINFDDIDSGMVRQYFTSNTKHWIDEYHLDGLRFDAAQQIFDDSTEHILTEMSRHCRAIAGDRQIYLTAESETQVADLVRPWEAGGHNMDSAWNDDFHHSAIVALTGRNEAYYSQHAGTPQEFVSAAKWGFLYQGQYYKWQDQPRGTPALDIAPNRFVTCLQNHDQVANSLWGKRVHRITSPGMFRTMTALLLLGPSTPLLFMGQEFSASTPFLYFGDHNPELARQIAAGRAEFLSQFPGIAEPGAASLLRNPELESTFSACKLDHGERERHSDAWLLHCDLIALRKSDEVISHLPPRGCDGAVLGGHAFVLRYFGPAHDDRLLLINMGAGLLLHPNAEPLLAPPQGHNWTLLWHSESTRYGGEGAPPHVSSGEPWHLPGHTAVFLKCTNP
jgi:maltooligosyltrehalose trehalohydrolase